MATRLDTNNTLRQAAGTTDGGQFAADRRGETDPGALTRPAPRVSPLPSELLAAASESDLAHLNERFDGNHWNRVDNPGVKAFDRKFAALESYELEHGTWSIQDQPDWFHKEIDDLMPDPSASVPRYSGSSIDLYNGTAAVALLGRFGGGNRECYCDEGEGNCTGCLAARLSSQLGYINDRDSEEDTTYATAFFEIADLAKRAEATRILLANEHEEAADARDRIVSGAPIWTLGDDPRGSFYFRGRPMADFSAYQAAITGAAAGQKLIERFDAGDIPDEEALAAALPSKPNLRVSLDLIKVERHRARISDVETANAKIAELQSTLDANLVAGAAETIIRDALREAQAERDSNLEKIDSEKSQVRALVAGLAKPADVSNHLTYDEKRRMQERIWGLSRVQMTNAFRNSDYFRGEVERQVRRLSGFDTLSPADQEKVLIWARQ